MIRCPNCRTENPAGKKFCGDCGAALANVCPKCDVDNPAGKPFCGDCGTALGIPAVAAAKKSNDLPIRVADSPAPENLEGERKTVTALFADIKGSTELEQDLDPEEARAIIDPALKLMIDAVQRYDGYIVQSTGDGIFALFGAPVAHEDHPQRALYAGLRMQEELTRYSARLREAGNLPIEARVGVNTGEVVVRSIATGGGHTEYTPIGHTTNLASRMQALAPTGSIATSEATRKFCEGYFTLKPLGPTRVKGVTEPVNVYEVTGLGPLRTRLQRSAGRGLTKFVGREREMAAMEAAAERAKSGHGQIVAAMAEAGTGKSRLFYEYKVKNQSGWMVLETFSVSHGKASAFLPLLDLLHGYFKITGDDDARARREKIGGKVLMLDRAQEDTLPYLFALLGIVEGEDPLAQMDGEIKKRRTLDAIKRILLRESLNQPLMVIFEDLHWIDGETQALLNLLADSIANAKILLLLNYRPEYSHQWNSKTYYTQLRLDPLGKESADEMLAALLGDGAGIAALKRVVIERTEGNPFFIEEIVQSLFEDGVLKRNETVRLMKPLNALKIPPTVQGILAARIDRLPTDAKELLQTLAVIGREFPVSLIRAVVTKSDDELNRLLNDLQLGEFIYEQPAVGDTEYIFKHALTQEVAYNLLLIERRQRLHDRIGAALETLYTITVDEHLAQLAHHYVRSANPGKAVEYLTRAGQQAQNRSAYAEAHAQLQQGLEWIKKLSASPERDARELELASALAQVLRVTRGLTASETRAAAERSRDLAEKGGKLARLVVELFGLWRSVQPSGDYSKAAPLADWILDLARREGSPASFRFAYDAQVSVRFFRGDLLGAEHFARLSGLADADRFGEVPGATVTAIGHASICAWALGHTDLARKRIVQALAFARDNNSPYDLALARYDEGWLSSLLREPQRAEVAATQALAIAEEHGFPFVMNVTRPVLGWARAQLGRAGEGVALIRQGVAGLFEAGVRVVITEHLTRLAEAQALDGKIDDALITVEEALQANPEELVFRPNALTCRGELRLKQDQIELAEADFRAAIALAQEMQAKAWELRATMSLARLLDRQGKRDEACTMLAAIYNWFTEGFDTADLKDARALLDELDAGRGGVS
jgi:class 3 adenylate cyclase/tetratricopeptide (TPR) repeat protein